LGAGAAEALGWAVHIPFFILRSEGRG
jgi:hypothetical protein